MRETLATKGHHKGRRLLTLLLVWALLLGQTALPFDGPGEGSASSVYAASKNYPTKVAADYDGWASLKAYDILYYKKNGREYSKKVADKNDYYFRNGKKLRSQWIEGRYLDKQGVACADRQGTLKRFLTTSMQPMGRTAYVYGGGWPSTGSRRDITKGRSKKWKNFYKSVNKNYDYRRHLYKYAYGLDCSGFVGWTVYNTVNKKSGGESFTAYASDTGSSYAKRGFGKVTKAKKIKKYQPGDILYNSGHVWICLGTCSDGSVLMVHSSPGGVQINGTPTPKGKWNSKAVRLARKYMKKYRPGWKFRVPVRDYLGDYHRFRWTYGKNGLMTDPDGWRKKSGEQILKLLFDK